MRVPEQYFTAQVQRAWSLTPAMRRIVLGGTGLSGFQSSGLADEWFRFLFPTDPNASVDPPSEQHGHWRFADPQPDSRWYTVRHWDAGLLELTVDVVIHGQGVATAWAGRACPGDEVVISSAVGRYRPPAEAEWELIVADLTGLPAAGRIISELPTGRCAQAILEVPNEECTVTFDTDADLEVCWIYNPSPDTIPSALHLATRSVDLRPEPGYVWMAGEAGCSRDLRRYFRHELGWSAQRYDIAGYWRPDAENYLKRYAQIESDVAASYEASQLGGLDTEDALDRVFEMMEAHGL